MELSLYRSLLARIFVSVPFERLAREIDQIVACGIQPEIGLEGECLYTTPAAEFATVAEKLSAAKLACTLHAPFFDLAPGALDPKIREASRAKLRRAFALLPLFKPKSVVCHLGYEANKHGYKKAAWFDHALTTFRELLALAGPHQTILALENTYEHGPEAHREMLTALDSPLARFCFDTGHTLAFADHSPWQEWFPALAPWLGELHLHDNQGGHDSHLPPGQGLFDFPGFFAYLKSADLAPLVTLEAHSRENLSAGLAALQQFDFPQAQPAQPNGATHA